jgi:hypothetical protein
MPFRLSQSNRHSNGEQRYRESPQHGSSSVKLLKLYASRHEPHQWVFLGSELAQRRHPEKTKAKIAAMISERIKTRNTVSRMARRSACARLLSDRAIPARQACDLLQVADGGT